jgi:hypothetical protein
MDFFLNYTSQITGEKLFIKELTFKQYKTLNKFLHNKNDHSINTYFEDILKTNLINYTHYNVLTNFDKFCLLFLLRISSISSDLELKKNNFTTKIDLLKMYSAIAEYKLDLPGVITDNAIEIKINLPKSLFFENLFTVFYEIIDTITIKTADNSQTIKFSTLTLTEKIAFYDNLPVSTVKLISEYKKQQEKQFEKLIFKINDEYSVNINPYNISLFEICKFLFFSDLKGLYDLHYFIVSKINYTPEYSDNSTFLENLMLLNNYTEESIRKEEEMKKSIDKSKVPLK